MAKYRIVKDNYAGYEVQFWRWWFPIWVMADFSNTHGSIEDAERWAQGFANNTVVKNLGKLK